MARAAEGRNTSLTSENAELKQSRDAALQRIGRNVLDLQFMERLLKFLLVTGNIGATASDIDAHVRSRVELFERMTLGQLINEAATVLFAAPADPSKITARPGEAAPWFQSRIEGGEEQMKVWREDMTAVRDQRNYLLHKMLATVDLDSIESCNQLSEQLDMQHSNLEWPLKSLADMVGHVRKDLGDGLHERILQAIDKATWEAVSFVR